MSFFFFHLTNGGLSFNGKLLVFFRDVDMRWLAFELVNVLINLTTDPRSYSRFNQQKTRKQPGASDQTIKVFATLLITEISYMARTYFRAWNIAEGPTPSKSYYSEKHFVSTSWILFVECMNNQAYFVSIELFIFQTGLSLPQTATTPYLVSCLNFVTAHWCNCLPEHIIMLINVRFKNSSSSTGPKQKLFKRIFLCLFMSTGKKKRTDLRFHLIKK